MPLIAAATSSRSDAVRFRFPVTWSSLVVPAGAEPAKWEMVVPRMERPAKLAPPEPFVPKLMVSDAIFERLRRLLADLWHELWNGFQSDPPR